MLNVAMPQIMLDRPRVLPVVCQLVAGGVAQHVRMDRELDAGLAAGSTDDLAHRIGAERRLALAHEYVGGVRVSPLQSAQGAQFRPAQGVDRGDPCFRRVTCSSPWCRSTWSQRRLTNSDTRR